MFELKARAILFDMDGTLVDSTSSVEATWSGWAARHGIALPTILAVSHGRRTVDTIRLVAPHLDAEEETRILEAEAFATDEGFAAVRGARRLLLSLRPDEWAVVTSAPHQFAKARLRSVGLPLPQHLVGSDDVHTGKPDPEGYLKGAKLLSASPDQCFVVEDTPAGILAGRAAGMEVLAIGTTYPRDALLGAPWVPDLEDVSFIRTR